MVTAGQPEATDHAVAASSEYAPPAALLTLDGDLAVDDVGRERLSLRSTAG